MPQPDKKLTKAAIKKKLYRLLELEYIQGVKVSISDLAKRNGVKPNTLQTYAQRNKWRDKRQEYLENLSRAKMDHLTGSAFSDLARKHVTDLANRLGMILDREKREFEEAMAQGDPSPDTVERVHQRLATVKSLMDAGLMAYGEITPADKQVEPVFEVVVSPIVVGYREVTVVEESAKVIVEVPPGMSVAEITGTDDDFEEGDS